MSTLRTNALEGMDAKNSITIVAGAGNITTTPVQKGLIKGFCVFFKQSDNTFGDTFNLSSVADGGTGRVDYTHTNPYTAADTYIALPNDGNYGYTKIAPQDLETTSCQQTSHTNGDSLSDAVMASAFGGDLA